MSDHISGPRALADPIADITDVYAFPSPERADRLVLVVNTLPMAKPSDRFSDGLLYRFRVRPLEGPAPQTGGWHFVPAEDEFVLDCVFSAPDGDRADASGQEGTCTSPDGRVGLVPRQRPAGRLGRRPARLRRHSVGPVHHGRASRPDDARDPPAGLHRPGLDLPRRQERAESRHRGRHVAAGWLPPRRRRRRDADARRGQRSHRARRQARGEEHDARAEGVRPGEPGPGDPRPLQHGGRVPPRRLVRRCLPRAAERQPRLLGRSGRQAWTGRPTTTATTR